MLSNINAMERTEKVTPFYQPQLAGSVRQQQLAGGVRQQQQQAGLEGVRVPQQDLGYAKEIRYHIHLHYLHIHYFAYIKMPYFSPLVGVRLSLDARKDQCPTANKASYGI
jgi:hypothetical protein